MEGSGGAVWGKGTGNKQNRWSQNSQGEVKNSIQEMEKPENLYVQPMDMNCGGGGMLDIGGVQGRGRSREEDIGTTVIA